MNQIKFIYFDVGGVLEIDFSANNQWRRLKRDLGVTEDKDSIYESIWDKHHHHIVTGLELDSLLPEFQQALGLTFPQNYSMLEDFVDRFLPNPSIHTVVDKAKHKYQLGLLTNMYPRMLDMIIKRKLIPDHAWDSIVDSSVVGYKKPDPEIYQHSEKQVGLEPSQILFIDNTQKNLDAARSRGWQTFLYDPAKPEKSSVKLNRYLNL